MKFEQNKINLYLGIGYCILAFISLFNLMASNILLGLSLAGFFFSLSLLGLAVENTLLPKKKLYNFGQPVTSTPSEDLKTIESIVYKKPKNDSAYKWTRIASGISFMLGFVVLVALPGFSLSQDLTNRLIQFSCIASIGVIFCAFYLEERQAEKTQKQGEKELVSYLFSKVKTSLAPSYEEEEIAPAKDSESQPALVQPEIPADDSAEDTDLDTEELQEEKTEDLPKAEPENAKDTDDSLEEIPEADLSSKEITEPEEKSLEVSKPELPALTGSIDKTIPLSASSKFTKTSSK